MQVTRFVCGVLLISSIASSAIARPTTTGWVVTNDDPAIKTLRRARDFNFLNLFTKRFMTARKRLGADVSGDGKTPRNIELSKREGADDIRCGEQFSIKIDGVFLTYDPRESGSANLGLRDERWLEANDPFEWRVGGCREGEIVVLGKPLALVNVHRADGLVGCRRIYGAPYCWDDNQLLGVAKD